MSVDNFKIAVIGLGYVGLPLAHAFSKIYEVVGFDINRERIKKLNQCIDVTSELSKEQLSEALEKKILFTYDEKYIKDCNTYIVTVPTPVTNENKPDLNPLVKASELVSNFIESGDIVIYESTVYPGATEEICVPILEKGSGLKYNVDFFCGYSPERINPGDKDHPIEKIVKVTSGSNQQIAKRVNDLYSSIIEVGTHIAPSIRVAEAAKVIENAQRDINIAFINELAIIFEKMDIDTMSVLEAAKTKWNFLDFRPGLVGGHCIGVDPYYLTYKAQSIGYNPEVILSGRRTNDNMGEYIASRVTKMLAKNNIEILKAKLLILGITFKENCPDTRNSKVIDVFRELKDYGCNVDISDCLADSKEVYEEYGIKLKSKLKFSDYDCIVLAVSHKEYINLKFNKSTLIFDVKSVLTNFTERL